MAEKSKANLEGNLKWCRDPGFYGNFNIHWPFLGLTVSMTTLDFILWRKKSPYQQRWTFNIHRYIHCCPQSVPADTETMWSYCLTLFDGGCSGSLSRLFQQVSLWRSYRWPAGHKPAFLTSHLMGWPDRLCQCLTNAMATMADTVKEVQWKIGCAQIMAVIM